MTDDQPMTGAEFRRWAGIDPARWAEACQRAHAEDDLDELTTWFRAAMRAAAATAEDAWMEVARHRGDMDVVDVARECWRITRGVSRDQDEA